MALAKNRRFNDEQLHKYYFKYHEELKVDNNILKDVVQQETGQFLTTKDINNLDLKFSKKAKQNELENTIKLLDDYKENNPGTTLHYGTAVVKNNKRVLKYVYLQNLDMKIALEKYGDVIFVDGHLSFNTRGIHSLSNLCC